MFIALGVICSIIFGYLLGSISNGVLVGKIFFGIDIRTMGSHNSGGTNTGRILGKKFGLLVIVLDILKTMISIWVTYFVISNISVIKEALVIDPTYFAYIAGFASCIGHTFPCFFSFKGGKSVACLGGICLATNWIIALIGITLFILIVLISKYVSLGSILTSISIVFISLIPFAKYGIYFNMTYDIYYTLLLGVVALLLIIRHSSNIKRLIHGNENKTYLLKKKEKVNN